MSYLIQGNSGTGKTWYARRAAMLVCERNIPFSKVDAHLDSVEDKDVTSFVSSPKCLHVQVNSATTFDDLVSVLPTFATGSANKSSMIKPLLGFFARAQASADSFAVIFDDIDRADVGIFFGPIIPALHNREFPLIVGKSSPIYIPKNVTFFFTASSGYRAFEPPVSFLSAMDGIKTLECSDLPLRRDYSSARLKKPLELATRLMSRVNSFIQSSQDFESEIQNASFQLGAGYFVVNAAKPVKSVLDDIRHKFKCLVDPLLRSSW